jgi:hypothetical protein
LHFIQKKGLRKKKKKDMNQGNPTWVNGDWVEGRDNNNNIIIIIIIGGQTIAFHFIHEMGTFLPFKISLIKLLSFQTCKPRVNYSIYFISFTCR